MKHLPFIIMLFHCALSHSQNTVRVIGHRGCRGIMPENSVVGFKKAIEDGADGIEWDVVVNGDGKLVISHEPYFHKDFCLDQDEKTIENEKPYNIYKMTQAEIEAFDCGSKVHMGFPDQQKLITRKPLLKDAVAKLKSSIRGKLILFEIKSEAAEYGISQPHPNEFVDLILNEVATYKFPNVVYMSFDKNIIEALHKKAPELRLAYLTYLPSKSANAYLKELSFKPFALGMYHKTLNKRKLRQLRDKGVSAYAWTINTTDDAHKMMDLGIDAIITDYPKSIIKARATYSDRPKKYRTTGTPSF